MKKLLLSVAVIATIGFTSCGESTDACSCKATTAEAAKAANDAGDDAKKVAAAAAADYADALAACVTAAKDGGDEYAKAMAECK